MYIGKNFSLKGVMRFSGHHFTWLVPFVLIVAIVEYQLDVPWLRMPWQPLSIVGTAVAFYLGFKNNQSYDRVWEARKVWGAIVNSSRAWGSAIGGFVTKTNAEKTISDHELKATHTRLLYRHIAWLYALRSQLLVPTPWEHVSQNGMVGRYHRKRRKTFGIDMMEDDVTKDQLHQFLERDEFDFLRKRKNMATQIINKQGLELKTLREENLIDDFRHMELQKILYDFYVHQGKLERIKKFPLPRQYGAMSFIFVCIFISILPFGIIPLFKDLMGGEGFIVSIVVTVLVAWIYLVMELVGDYSENPFEGSGNDIPMYSLCRTIEIDLREMLGETDLPAPVEAINKILM